jgi:hypothetical protein
MVLACAGIKVVKITVELQGERMPTAGRVSACARHRPT